MLDKLTQSMDFQGQALTLRAERQRVIAGNIANADTPGYAARELDFAAALSEATASDRRQATGSPAAMAATDDGRSDGRHFRLAPRTSDAGSSLAYTAQVQPAMDGNSVDLDRERAAFADNAVRYEATLRFLNGQGKTLMSAIQGQ
ncbi:flagellar basal body rod protein FlgB [uncultured Pseudacidovorax sp.]|uniref:flagellar basal body rod protein FlgB n=1 Tax=uncultured Pseudacidovorax sp. TaxID=679313 RepID=UPI0025E30060|nr:flagellar basal body rod protein FlgB [uncultured Pseudacidovorax sp.]